MSARLLADDFSPARVLTAVTVLKARSRFVKTSWFPLSLTMYVDPIERSKPAGVERRACSSAAARAASNRPASVVLLGACCGAGVVRPALPPAHPAIDIPASTANTPMLRTVRSVYTCDTLLCYASSRRAGTARRGIASSSRSPLASLRRAKGCRRTMELMAS